MAHRLPSAGLKTLYGDHFMFHRVVGPEEMSGSKKYSKPVQQTKTGAADQACGLRPKTKCCCPGAGPSSKPEPPATIYCKMCKCTGCPQYFDGTPRSSGRCPDCQPPLPCQRAAGHRLACWPVPNSNTCVCPDNCQMQDQQQQQQDEKKKQSCAAKKKQSQPAAGSISKKVQQGSIKGKGQQQTPKSPKKKGGAAQQQQCQCACPCQCACLNAPPGFEIQCSYRIVEKPKRAC